MAIADDLNEHLSQKYRVAIEKRNDFSGGDGSLLVAIPDVTIVSKRAEENQSNAATQLLTEPITVTLPMAEEV